ncbi:MAG: nucleotide exchange factor GrpE [Gammaproteobacteria bacterium]|nr:MAG: nucleotide exchange factor GrpE [Gammaproteobacteria bacterium]
MKRRQFYMTNDAKDHESKLIEHPSYDELMQKLDKAEQESSQHWERILRMQADHENFKRRVERDRAEDANRVLKDFAIELLPIVDSLELSIAAEPGNEGVKLTLKMFYTAMEKFGIKQVNPVGEIFSPEYQQAISMQVDPAVEPGHVISVLQKGYTLNNRLLRPALVVVAKEKE